MAVRRPRGVARDGLIETDWAAEEWTRGAYASTFGIGGLTRFGEDLRRPVGPIHWACADIAGFGHMHMEGGIRSGEAAAEGCARPLAKRLGVERRELADAEPVGRAGAHTSPEQEADERDTTIVRPSVSVASAFRAGVGAVRPVE